jgi:hypothetical protein
MNLDLALKDDAESGDLDVGGGDGDDIRSDYIHFAV